MTCIVGLEHEGRVWMGGDSAGITINNLSLRVRGDSKVFSVDDVLFGFTSSFRMGQLLRFSLEIPRQIIKNDYHYLCTDFVDAVRNCLKTGGFATTITEEAGGKQNSQQGEQGGTFLIGYRGKLYNIQSDYQVGIPTISFDACGCGEDYALGNLLATKGSTLSPRKRILKALTAATYFSAGVSPPFSILVSKKYST